MSRDKTKEITKNSSVGESRDAESDTTTTVRGSERTLEKLRRCQ